MTCRPSSTIPSSSTYFRSRCGDFLQTTFLHTQIALWAFVGREYTPDSGWRFADGFTMTDSISRKYLEKWDGYQHRWFLKRTCSCNWTYGVVVIIALLNWFNLKSAYYNRWQRAVKQIRPSVSQYLQTLSLNKRKFMSTTTTYIPFGEPMSQFK